MTPPEPALPHRPTAPQRPGERDGEGPTVPPWLPPPPSSSAPSSPSDNGSTGKWPNPGGPHSPRLGGTPAPAPPPQPWRSGQPHWKGGSWQRAGAGTPHLRCPPCSDLTPPKRLLAASPSTGLCPGASAGKRQGRSEGETPPKCIRPLLWPCRYPGQPPLSPQSCVTALCVGAAPAALPGPGAHPRGAHPRGCPSTAGSRQPFPHRFWYIYFFFV